MTFLPVAVEPVKLILAMSGCAVSRRTELVAAGDDVEHARREHLPARSRRIAGCTAG